MRNLKLEPVKRTDELRVSIKRSKVLHAYENKSGIRGKKDMLQFTRISHSLTNCRKERIFHHCALANGS